MIFMIKKLLILVTLVTLVLSVSGCTGDDEGTAGESVSFEEEGVQYEASIPADAEGQWCPVGSTIQTEDPQTGQTYNVNIIGIEDVNGIEMCHATAEFDEPQNGVYSLDYFWSEDHENVLMTFYDADGLVVSEMKVLDGQVSISAANGFSMEFDEDTEM